MKRVFEYQNCLVFCSNSYFIVNDSNEALMVDPGDSTPKLFEYIKKNGFNVVGVLLTHSHYDHIAALPRIIEELNPVIYITQEDYECINNPTLNASKFIAPGITFKVKSDKFVILKDYQKINFLDFEFECIKTPFHTSGSCCYLFDEIETLITGDTLFKRGIGRYDLPNSEPHKIKPSLAKLAKLSPTLTIYPGHGDKSILGKELKNWL